MYDMDDIRIIDTAAEDEEETEAEAEDEAEDEEEVEAEAEDEAEDEEEADWEKAKPSPQQLDCRCFTQ